MISTKSILWRTTIYCGYMTNKGSACFLYATLTWVLSETEAGVSCAAPWGQQIPPTSQHGCQVWGHTQVWRNTIKFSLYIIIRHMKSRQQSSVNVNRLCITTHCMYESNITDIIYWIIIPAILHTHPYIATDSLTFINGHWTCLLVHDKYVLGCLYIMYIFLNTAQDQEYKYNESHLKPELHSLCVYPYWANKADSDFSVYDLNIK